MNAEHIKSLQDVAHAAAERLREVLMHSDHTHADHGYPDAIRSICDKIDSLIEGQTHER